MLYSTKGTQRSRQALRNRRRKICMFCSWIMMLMILAGTITVVVIEVKNWDGMYSTEEAPYEEVYVIAASTEEGVVGNSGTSEAKGSVHSAGTMDSPEMVLVNKEHQLPADYEVALHTLNNGQVVAELMYEDLRDMLFTGEAEEKISFIVCSGYRDESQQNQLLEEEIVKNQSMGMSYEAAKEDALLTVAAPGHSEHETGLAVDIVAETNQRLDDSQEHTRENQWLQKNCYKYGFILRYPKGKEDITGYSYESWHFRYVGKEAAKEIMEQGIALEEYLE